MNQEKQTTPRQLNPEQQQLVVDHMRQAEQLVNKINLTNIDREELYQAAYLGLCRAALNHDPSKGASFRTYMHWFVISELMQAIRIIRGTEACSVDDWSDDSEDGDAPQPVIEPGVIPFESLDNVEYVQTLLDRLPALDREILEHLYGINGRTERPMVEVANIMGVSAALLYRRLKVILANLNRMSQNTRL